MLKITKDAMTANLITHASKFHADEVFGTAFMMHIIDDPIVCRVNNVPDQYNENAIIYDIGSGKFDHHMKDFDERHESGVKYAAFGLLFREYGLDYLKKVIPNDSEEAFKMIEHDLVEGIDAVDNGEFPTITANYSYHGIESLINEFNVCWDDDTDNDKYFLEAVNIAYQYFDRVVLRTAAKLRAKVIVDEAISNSSNHIMELDGYMPFKDFVISSSDPKANDILFVITPSNRGGYNIHTIPRDKTTHETRLDFPKEWGGLMDKELQEITGVETARFCHKELFLATAGTREDAYKMANLAINNKNV